MLIIIRTCSGRIIPIGSTSLVTFCEKNITVLHYATYLFTLNFYSKILNITEIKTLEFVFDSSRRACTNI